MRRTNKFLSIILAVIMVISIIPITASAAISGKCGYSAVWSYDATTKTLTISGTGSMYEYGSSDRPWESYEDSIETIVVSDGITIIDANVFYDCNNLTNVTFGNDVTKIGKYAFYYCSSLESATLPDGLTTIDSYAFASCSSLNSITIPDTLTTIGTNILNNCDIELLVYYGGTETQWNTLLANNKSSGLSNFIVHCTDKIIYPSGVCGDNLTWIFDPITDTLTISGTGAMYDYGHYFINPAPWDIFEDDIKTVVINDGVTTIGNNAFYSCENITSITIPDSVISIGDSAIYSCKSLADITIPDSVISIGGCAFSGCDNFTSVTIPNSVTTLGDGAFETCINLTNVTIGKGVTELGDSLLKNCDNLASITIPDNIQAIGDETFYYCRNLKEITIPDSVTTIGNEAFYGCDNLVNVTIGDGVTTIGDSAFETCNNLETIKIGAGLEIIGECAFLGTNNLTNIIVDTNNPYYSSGSDGVLFNKDKTKLVHYVGNKTSYSIPNSVTVVGDWAFARCDNLTSVTIPNSVTTIGIRSFYMCDNLTNVTIPNSVTTIGEWAFAQCNSLNNIKIPDSIKTIETYTFYKCTSLTNVTIPYGVTTVGSSAFANCTSLESIIIPDSVTEIESYAFNGCSKLKDITIGDGVSTVGGSAFYRCNNLTNVFYADTEEQWASVSIVNYNNQPLLNATIHYNYTPPFTGIKDNHFYKDDVMQKAYQLVEFDGDFYYIGDRHEIVKDKNVYIKAGRTNGLTYEDGTPITAGSYNFDENGKMVILNGIVGNNIYKNNVQLKAYQLVEVDGDFYYIGDRHEIVKNKKVYIKAERLNGLTYADGTPITAGYYEFDAEGKMVILNGVVGNKIYKNNTMLKAYQLVEFDGDFYYIGDRHEIVKDKKVYIKAERLNGLTYEDGTPLNAGWYTFDENGKLIKE